MTNQNAPKCPHCGSNNIKSFKLWHNLIALSLIVLFVYLGVAFPLVVITLLALNYYLKAVPKENSCLNCKTKFNSKEVDLIK